MTFEPLSDDQITEMNYSRKPLGPSSKAICQVLNDGACGSGTLVGVRSGKSLVLSNAHVAGTKIGKRIRFNFPHAGNQGVMGKVIMAGYSDRVMMDWAVCELDIKVNLPHVKLCYDMPRGDHYTGGYPRCRGPFYQSLQTRRIQNNGTVWRWQPNSIGGQSGSGVHSFEDNLQYGLLTWSWGGDGAGQTCRSIWQQYVTRTAIGIPRPEGLIELAENKASDLEEGFFSETNITTLPIWEHLEEPDDDGDAPVTQPELAAKLRAEAKECQKQAERLSELAKKYAGEQRNEDEADDSGPLFGL